MSLYGESFEEHLAEHVAFQRCLPRYWQAREKVRTMTPEERLLRKAEAMQALADQLRTQAAEIAQFGNDEDYPVGVVLRWERTMQRLPDPEHTYTYVALKADDGLWYLTGRTRTGMRFDALVNDFLRHADGDVDQATGWEAI